MPGGSFVDSSATPNQAALNARFTALKGTSPWRSEKPAPVDTTSVLSCPELGCGSRFITAGGKSAEQHLAVHVEDGHAADAGERANAPRRRMYRAKVAAKA